MVLLSENKIFIVNSFTDMYRFTSAVEEILSWNTLNREVLKDLKKDVGTLWFNFICRIGINKTTNFSLGRGSFSILKFFWIYSVNIFELRRKLSSYFMLPLLFSCRIIKRSSEYQLLSLYLATIAKWSD